MIELHFDMETIPAQEPWVINAIEKNIKPPGNIKKDESIQKWWADKAPEKIDEEMSKTSFNGSVGEIICIGFAIGDGDVELVIRKLGESEADMLKCFIARILELSPKYEHAENVKQEYQWIGHYITGFDLHFLWQRMIVNGVIPPFPIPHTAKPWHSTVFDTCHEWKMDTSGFGSLEMALKCLGIDKAYQEEFDGSMVWAAIQRGEYEKVGTYCKGDVEDSRKLYHRLTVF